ncbi:MAG: metallophosphoesterase [Oscillospiraceae bacterium]|nr:metallophosphoesterase [Oscillospiraceae bacterium]
MSIFAISDLHFAFDKEKPMDIFGENWGNHEKKIQENWQNEVKGNDLILLPGDLSWAMNLEENYKEFQYLENLPGKKILLKGNHDYWWTTLTNMKKYLDESGFKTIELLHNNSFLYENYIIAGTRGWVSSNLEEDVKILKRELIRLELSIENGIRQFGNDKEIIVMMHYPPFIDKKIGISFIELMNKYNVKTCIYGHIHGHFENVITNVENSNIEFKLVSADYLDFKLLLVE